MTVKIDTNRKCINSIKGAIFAFVPGITGALLSMGIGTNHFDYSEFRVFRFIFAPLIIICIVDIVYSNRKAINQISFEDNKIIVESNGQSSSFGYDDIFVEHGTVEQIENEYNSIFQEIIKNLRVIARARAIDKYALVLFLP